MNIRRSENYANLNYMRSFELTFCRHPFNEQSVVKIVYTAEPSLTVSSLQQRQFFVVSTAANVLFRFPLWGPQTLHTFTFTLISLQRLPLHNGTPNFIHMIPSAFLCLSLYLCAVKHMSCTNSAASGGQSTFIGETYRLSSFEHMSTLSLAKRV